jgi:hypothetical protein
MQKYALTFRICNNDQKYLKYAFAYAHMHFKKIRALQSIRGDERVHVNKPSPVSPQLTARSGQSAQFMLFTAFGRTLTYIRTLDTPATVHPSRLRCMISF